MWLGVFSWQSVRPVCERSLVRVLSIGSCDTGIFTGRLIPFIFCLDQSPDFDVSYGIKTQTSELRVGKP